MDEVERGRPVKWWTLWIPRTTSSKYAKNVVAQMLLIRPLFRKRAARRIALNSGMHAWGQVGRSGDLYSYRV